MGLSDWIKVEVIPDPKYLLPDPVGDVRGVPDAGGRGVYRPAVHQRRPGAGAAVCRRSGRTPSCRWPRPSAVVRGLKTREQVQIIIEQATVPVVVDAGIGVPSEAAAAMELGADCCLINTAIARAADPAMMAEAMRMGVEAGRKAFLAGRMPVLPYASASSPTEGIVR